MDIITADPVHRRPQGSNQFNQFSKTSSLLKMADAFLVAQFAAGKVPSFLPKKNLY